MKNCTNKNCKQVNPQSLDYFSKKKGSKDGLRYLCKKCDYERIQEYYKDNPDKKKAHVKKSRVKHTEKYRAADKVRNKAYLGKPENNKKHAELCSKWKKDNPGKCNAISAKYHASKLQRTPPWLTKLHYQQIEIFYDAAAKLSKEFGILMEVDHIIPLQGENISGLHVPWNLQVISKSQNCQKKNKFEG